MSRQETEDALRDYTAALRENLNFRLFCEAKQDISLWETILPRQEILWVEDVVLVGISYPKEKKGKKGNGCRRIREWFRRIKELITNLF